MNIQILHRHTRDIIFEHNVGHNTIRITVETAMRTAGVNLCYADLSEADLYGVDFSKTNCSYIDFSGADLSYTDFSNACCSHTSFSRANISNANFSRANCWYANFSQSNGFGVDLANTSCFYANFSRADLSYADLSGTNLSGSNFSGAKFLGTKLSNAVITDVSGDKVRLHSLNLDTWNIVIDSVDGVMAIGCKQYTIAEWGEFTNDEIAVLVPVSFASKTRWKPFIKHATELLECNRGDL